MNSRFTPLLLFYFAASSSILQAQQTPPPLPSGVKVTKYENVSRVDTGDELLFRRDYLRLWVDSLAKFKAGKPADGKIILYIDNIPFEDLEPEFENDSIVVFLFQKNPIPEDDKKEESKAWAYFYKKPRKWVLCNREISIGYKGGSGVPTEAKVDIVIIQGTWYVVGIILIAALLGILVWLSLKSSLLRDGGSLAPEQRPYSLARTQFAIWLLLISSAYIFLWISTGELPVLTNSSLILLGISGGTSVIAKLIDNTQSLHVSSDRRSQHFLIDILSDEKGISIHRLQMLVFTLVIGVIFCHDVLVIFEMPDFDTNLLMLMGISSGTYAGFKITENNPTTPIG